MYDNFDPPDDSVELSYWQRLIFVVVLPHLIVYPILYYTWPKGWLPPGGGGGPESPGIFALFAWAIWAFVVLLLLVLPVFVGTLLMSFRPWEQWYTAVLGGFVGVALGGAIGGLVVLIIGLFS